MKMNDLVGVIAEYYFIGRVCGEMVTCLLFDAFDDLWVFDVDGESSYNRYAVKPEY